MDFSKLCRSCMKELTQNDMNIFDQSSMDMFLFCTRIQLQIAEHDDFPKHFCPECSYQLKCSYEFIKHAQEINHTLKILIFENKGVNDFDVDNNDYLEFDSNSDIKFNDVENLYETEAFENTKDDLVHNVETTEEHIDFDQTQNQVNEELTKKITKERKHKTRLAHKLNSKSIENIDILPINSKDNENTNDNNSNTSHSTEINTEDASQANTVLGSTIKSRTTNTPRIFEADNANSDLTCPICSKTYTHIEFLNTHLKNKHKKSHHVFNEEEIENMKVKEKGARKNRDLKSCPTCNRMFKLQAHLNNHIEKLHTGSKQYFCPYCPTICPTPGVLRYHKSKHAEDKRFACNACGKRFRLRKGLAVHAISHTDERPYICDCCHMSFKMKQVLIKHMSVHENKHAFLCHICAKGFNSQQNLQEHMPKHTGERSFACARAECNYKSAYRSSLRRHELRHDNHRPHACHQCQKAFYERTALKRHMRIHTGEKPFKCPSCPLTFIDHWKRKTHIMRVHQVPFGEIPRLAADGQPITNW